MTDAAARLTRRSALSGDPGAVADLPPCTSCGACCTSEYDEGVIADLTEKDVKRLGPRRLKLYAVNTGRWEDPHYATSTHEDADIVACRALRGTPGRRCSCRIYDDRPEVCRDFKRGGRACLDARRGLFGAP